MDIDIVICEVKFHQPNFSWCLTKHRLLKPQWGLKLTVCIRNIEAKWKCMVNYTSCCFIPWKRAPGSHWMGGRVGPGGGVNAVGKTNIFASVWNWRGGRDISVGIATRYGLDGPGIESRWVGDIFRTRPDRPWGPPSLLYSGYRVFPGVNRQGLRVDRPPRLAPRLKKV
jgi:hypothetical protein